MNNLGLDDLIKESRDNTNISYMLEQENLFFETGYKVLQNQEKNGFIKCVKVSHNGKIKLVYDISKYKSFQSLLHQITMENFLAIVGRVLEIVSEVKNNGFMQCENIDVNLDKIFIDNNNLNVFLIYLSVNIQTNLSSIGTFERELKKNLAEAISENKNLNKEMAYGLFDDLQNDNYRLDEIKDNMQKNIGTRVSMSNELNGRSLEATSVNSNIPFENSLQAGQKSGPLKLEDSPFDGREIEKAKSMDTTKHKRKPKINHKSKPKTIKSNTIKPKTNSSNMGLIKSHLLLFIQVITVAICVATLLSLGDNSITAMIISGITVAIDIIATVLIYIFIVKKKKDANSIGHMDFKPIYEGGATEILTGIFVPSIALEGIGTPENIQIVISKSEFIIGKKPEAVDGVIEFNKTISRVHCKITYVNNAYVIQDLESANGTYVNSVRIQKGEQISIKIGDKIRLSNCNFIVKTIK